MSAIATIRSVECRGTNGDSAAIPADLASTGGEFERGSLRDRLFRTFFRFAVTNRRAVEGGNLWQIYNMMGGRNPLRYPDSIVRWDMIRRNCILSVFAILLLAGLEAAPANAQARVGEAAVIKNQVLRVTGSGGSQINVGDAVLRDETVHTGLDSAARLVMADSTNLSLGPNATIKLDRTVFDDEHTYRDIAIRLTTGAFRFVTGHSAKAAYKITTSLATIGVRGTILDILSERGKTTVVLQEGGSSVCTLTSQCIQLEQPGDTAVITASANGRRSTIKKTNMPPWTFAAACAKSAGLCSVTDLAQASVPPPADDPGTLCGL